MIIHNETMDTILTRCSVRRYQSRQISADELETILAAGSHAPSGMNQRPARVVVIQSQAGQKALLKLAKTVTGKTESPFYGAPTVLLMFAKKSALTPVEDASLAMENMMLAAHSLGLGACWIFAAKAMFHHPEGVRWKQTMGISEEEDIIGSLAVGYPEGERPMPKPGTLDFYRMA